MSPDRIRAKASTYVAAYKQRHGVEPSHEEVVMALSVAFHESAIGDAGGAWTGLDNWGATTERKPTADEYAAIGFKPTGKSVNQENNRAQFKLMQAGKRWQGLEQDYNAYAGHYWVFFFWGKTDLAAASYFELYFNRPNVTPWADLGDVDNVSEAMYTNHYFTGTHDGQWVRPHGVAGQWDDNDKKNIADYAKAIRGAMQTVRPALASFDVHNPGPMADRGPDPKTPTPDSAGGGSAVAPLSSSEGSAPSLLSQLDSEADAEDDNPY